MNLPVGDENETFESPNVYRSTTIILLLFFSEKLSPIKKPVIIRNMFISLQFFTSLIFDLNIKQNIEPVKN
jgi:hypothetical protein